MSTPSKAHQKNLQKLRMRHHETSSQDSNAFRFQESYWKSRLHPPDLKTLFQPQKNSTLESTKWTKVMEFGDTTVFAARIVQEKDQYFDIYTFESLPGFFLIPNYLSPHTQRILAAECIKDAPCHPNSTNLDSHYNVPQTGLWSSRDQVIIPKAAEISLPAQTSSSTQRIRNDNGPATYQDVMSISKDTHLDEPTPSPRAKPTLGSQLISKLRWATVGLRYHWTSKSYKFNEDPPPIPKIMYETSKQLIVTLSNAFSEISEDCKSWSNYEPEAGVVNYYTAKDSLTAHIDHSEPNPHAPLVSFSLGLDGVFLVGGTNRDVKPIPILLKSGDACILSGHSRRVFHGIPRVFEGPLPHPFDPDHIEDTNERQEWISSSLLEYLQHWRMNINLRQVF